MGSKPGKREFKSLKTRKKEAIRMAKQLGYSSKCLARLTDASSCNEIEIILRTERLGGN